MNKSSLAVPLIPHWRMFGEQVADFLNTEWKENPEQKEAVTRVFYLCREFEALPGTAPLVAKTIPKTVPEVPRADSPDEEKAAWADWVTWRTYNDRDSILQRLIYQLIEPYLLSFMPRRAHLGARSSVQYLPAGEARNLATGEARIEYLAEGGGKIHNLNIQNPTWIAYVIVQMAVSEQLNRVRQCSCERWFFAGSSKKLTCSAACRYRETRESARTKKGKEKHRRYMRDRAKNPAVKKAKEKKKQATKKK